MIKQVEKVRLLEFEEHNDTRGNMVVVEGLKNIPFDIKRIFYIYDTDPGVIRGSHANRKSEFVLINVSGSSKVKIIDNDYEGIYILDKPNIGIYLPKMVWKEMYDFSSDSVLLTLASEPYDEKEYVRNYEDFLKEGADIE